MILRKLLLHLWSVLECYLSKALTALKIPQLYCANINSDSYGSFNCEFLPPFNRVSYTRIQLFRLSSETEISYIGYVDMSEVARPIIIRRKKVVAGGGHHGGAWKVAYADFVTAMMAFFLLMWLLNATTEEQRKGIADYFSPNIPLAAVSGGGSGALSGDSIYTQDTLSRSGTGVKTTSGHDTLKVSEAAQKKAQEQVDALNKALAAANTELLEHVSLKMSDQGLVIELIDSNSDPLFSVGQATPSPLLKELLQVFTQSFNGVQNNIKIVGHTDGRAFVTGNRYSNWELSTDRANTARRLLIDYGFPYAQISEVSGKAYTDPLATDPLAAKNRRIAITLLQ